MRARAESRRVLTVREVADQLRISESTVRRRIKDGSLPTLKLGPRRSVLRVDERELEEWLYS